ncbi:MAG: hypothetical protein CVT95_08960 [Bacteroidetes bacterium HGW-Bacteroidetes-12]|nr:MAG: hypothetical protein CVT95_08960 [Bacteroidetes bacterium HGW-Bacteroidetes-12]
MQFYEPGPYEEYVAKLSSISVKPSHNVWQAINNQLDEASLHRKKLVIRRFTYAASFLLLIGLSVSFLLINNLLLNSQFLAQGEGEVFILSLAAINNPQKYNQIEILNSSRIKEEEHKDITELKQTIIIENELQESKPLINAATFVPYEFPHLSDVYNNSKAFVRESISKTHESNIIKENRVTFNEKGGSSWSLIAYLNPSYSYHTSAALNYQLNSNESGAWMWGGEVLVKKEFSDYFAVYSGIQVSPSGQNINDLTLLQNSGTNKEMEYLTASTSFGQIIIDNTMVDVSNFSSLSKTSDNGQKSSSINTTELKQRFYYMEIPLIFSTSFKTGLVDVEVKLGCAAGVLIDNKFEVISSNGHFVGRTENIRPHNASAIGAISLSIPMNNQLSFILEPNIRLNLYPLSYGYEATYPFAASVKLGMGYRF